MRQRIHAGGRGDRRRQVERQLGIGEHHLGQELRREDDLLDVRLVVGDDAGAADLGAGARGRRQRDEVRQLVLDRAHLRMIPGVFEHVARVRRHQRDRLGDVERRAAAEADDRIGAMRAVRRDAVIDLALDRVAPDVRNRPRRRGRQVGDELREQRQRRDAAVGDDQRPLQALLVEVLGRRACARRGRSGSSSERRSG